MNSTLALNDNGVNKKNANKAKKQRKHKKLKIGYHKNISSFVSTTSTTTSIAGTSTTTTTIATTKNTTSFLAPPSSSPPIVLPIVQPPLLESNQSVNTDKTEPVTNYDLTTQNQDLNSFESTHDLEPKGISAAAIVGTDSSSIIPNQQSTSVKAVHIVGPVLGIFAGIAFIAAAMFLVVRNRNNKRKLTTNESNNNYHHHDDNTFHTISLDDEAIFMPPLIDEKKRSIISSSSNDYHSMSDTLIGSNKSTKKQNSWQSVTNSTLVSHHISSFLMVAERQQLQHEKPNILDHFNRMPIETYKAQLADILSEEEDYNPLPFISIHDLSDFYK